jgi:WD40 repeat protein/energy-coupling factor transporter ATP-binding protein EcfA2
VNGEQGQLGHRPYLSYAPPDRPKAQQLHAALRARGLDPWIDVSAIRPGDVWEEALEGGLVECTSMIVLCTSTPPSDHQHQEWGRARQLGRPLVPVLLGAAVLPEPLAGLHAVVSKDVSEELADTLYELSGDVLELGPPPPGLLEAASKGELVLFVGAGLAAGAGYPMWSELVTRLLDWAERKQRLDPELLRSLRSSLRAGEHNSVADTVAESIDRSELAKSLGEVFGFEERTLLVTGSGDGTARLWDVATGAPIGDPLTGHTGQVTAVAGLELDGRPVLATGSSDRTVRLWDVATGAPIGDPLTGHTGRVTAVAGLELDGRPVLATGSSDRTVRLWDVATGAPIGDPLTGHTGRVTAVAGLELDGRPVLATCSSDGSVRLWDVARGAPSEILNSHAHPVTAVATLKLDGRAALVTGGDDGTARLWDAATGAPIGDPFIGHTGPVTALATLELDGRPVLASGGFDGTVRLWDAATGAPIGHPLTGQSVAGLAVSDLDGRPVVASGGFDQTVWLWDVATGAPIGDPLTGHTGPVTALAAIRYYDGQIVQSRPDVYRALDAVPVAGALTTNYDRLLDQIWTDLPRLTLRESGRVLDHLSLRNPFVLHVYGRPDDPQSLVFSPAQFGELLDSNLEVAKALESVFASRTLLFVGSSLQGISDFVQSLSIRSRTGPAHYAVAHADSPTWRAQADHLRRRYNIEVLAYGGASHEQLNTFLSRLGGRTGRPPRDGVHGRAEKLASVQLENIGPYEHLELDLDQHWNVLLGDNGVGKSSILKAIALVYSADEGPIYADRLLRVGASHGSIRVETDTGRSFHTELLRSTTGVQVRHAPGVRLEAEGQLVLGLPPLRSLSWRRESGPGGGETSKRPSASDLLPLLAGDLDPRLDSVKQRIINCDYRIKDAQAKGADASPQLRLLEDLAHAMHELTDKLAVQFLKVDAASNAVFVNTVDGLLPIEALSQGTGALIAWVSLIIQRLHDTAAEGEVPLQREAIVLVDELDAHLHPDWQQQLTFRLGSLFPGVQFVATTHSPLIVGGMKYRQVTALTREDGLVTKVQLAGDPDEEIRGRADQLLTGQLFGLTTSVDIETRHAVERYNELLGKDRTPDEDALFHELQQVLEVRIPVSATTPAERRARELLDLLLRESVGSDLPEVRAHLLEKAGLLLEEAGRMRPVVD